MPWPRRPHRLTTRTARHDAGETLVEIILTVVIVGVAVTALISGLASTAAASTTNRHTADADTVVRNLAEAIKDASRDCVEGNPIAISYTPPAGFGATVVPANPVCPSVTSTALLTIDVDTPSGGHQSMQIVVRTP